MSIAAPAIGARPVTSRARFETPGEAGRPLLRVTAFAALSLLGALRWGTLLHPAPVGRLLGLVALAAALALVGPVALARSRILAVLAGLAVVVATLAVSGLPVSWITHVRIAVSARSIGDGLVALPGLLLPYRGVNESVHMVMLMGAGVLLVDAAVMVAFAMGPSGDPLPGGDLRRAIAALPLVALAAVPLTLVPAQLPYVQGLLMFVLLAALVWGERLPPSRTGAAALACAAAAFAAMVAAPALHARKPWIDYQSLAGGVSAGAAESFNWSQTYGRLTWPQDGRQVLSVKAPRAAYWKAVDLDAVDAGGWSEGSASAAPWWTGVSAASLRHWTEKLTVTIGAMKTTQVIGAGEFSAPQHALAGVAPGASPGTWQTTRPLDQGDAYQVSAYVPNPSAAQLAAAGTRYPAGVAGAELALGVPTTVTAHQTTVFFAPFGSPRDPSAGLLGESGVEALSDSPYAQAYRLALRLRAGAATPYAYLKRVQAYLGRGYRYDLNPPASPYPLETFLFASRRGYCQQFAGAMALLLRMGGVPARVAAGFTSGQQDAATHRWLVTDLDAHAWVEAFFPGYGWVTFDPTPAADPALARTPRVSLLAAGATAATNSPSEAVGHRQSGPTAASKPARAHSSGGSPWLLAPLVAVGVVLVALAGLAVVPRRPPTAEQLLADLERAFARAGRPLAPQITLTELERRLDGAAGAQAYVRALARTRFAGGGPLPSAAGRRALRAHLRSGLGLTGPLRVLWALPPRRWQRRTTPAAEPDGPRA